MGIQKKDLKFGVSAIEEIGRPALRSAILVQNGSAKRANIGHSNDALYRSGRI